MQLFFHATIQHRLCQQPRLKVLVLGVDCYVVVNVVQLIDSRHIYITYIDMISIFTWCYRIMCFFVISPAIFWLFSFHLCGDNRMSGLTHWGRVTHICVSKLRTIGSDNGLSPGRRQAIIWTHAGILLIGPLGTNFSEILIEIPTFSFKKMRLKVPSAKWRPFCVGLNVLTHYCLLLTRLAYCRGYIHSNVHAR